MKKIRKGMCSISLEAFENAIIQLNTSQDPHGLHITSEMSRFE